MTPGLSIAILVAAKQTRSETMNAQELKAEMRLYVMETMIANLLVGFCLQANPHNPSTALTAMKQQMIEGAKRQTFSHLKDPAQSDLYSAELEAAASRLGSLASEQMSVMEAYRSGKSRP
jgi:hypothetical protein